LTYSLFRLQKIQFFIFSKPSCLLQNAHYRFFKQDTSILIQIKWSLVPVRFLALHYKQASSYQLRSWGFRRYCRGLNLRKSIVQRFVLIVLWIFPSWIYCWM